MSRPGQRPPAAPGGKPSLKISLHGPGASIEDAIQTADAMKGLLATVGETMGIQKGTLDWQVVSIAFQCDGCGLQRANRPGPDEGWTYRDGDDLCPACTALADSDSSSVGSAPVPASSQADH